MKANLRSIRLLMFIIILIGMVGCNIPEGLSSEDKIQTQVAETMSVMHAAETLVAQGEMPVPIEVASQTATISQAETATATITASPTVTLTPTITLTSTKEAPMASVSTDTNCRTGPDKIYENVGALLVGEQAEVVGKFGDGSYWIIKNPDRSGECWLWGYYATVVGPTDGLETYAQPPTPTPAFDWGGTWSVSIGPAEGGIYTTRTMTATVTGKAFTASIDFGGPIITYSGTISDDYLAVSGTWQENEDETGPFKFYALGVNQFQGNFTDGPAFGFCGAKGGGGFPSPCYRP